MRKLRIRRYSPKHAWRVRVCVCARACACAALCACRLAPPRSAHTAELESDGSASRKRAVTSRTWTVFPPLRLGHGVGVKSEAQSIVIRNKWQKLVISEVRTCECATLGQARRALVAR
ncbi:unnamed protein product [Colias eurytheme]|nr:unnamed protein product [Colias eurytheme]